MIIFLTYITKTIVLGTQKNSLIETALLSNHNTYVMFWVRNKKIDF